MSRLLVRFGHPLDRIVGSRCFSRITTHDHRHDRVILNKCCASLHVNGSSSFTCPVNTPRLFFSTRHGTPPLLLMKDHKVVAGKQDWKSSQMFSSSTEGSLDQLTFENLAEETLENLLEFLEELGDEEDSLTDFDVTYSSGVLTVSFGHDHGTYVINKQSPNKQIWLSSPTSGPKRYDYVNNEWVYSHDGIPMDSLLSEEISKIVGKTLDFCEVMRTSYT